MAIERDRQSLGIDRTRTEGAINPIHGDRHVFSELKIGHRIDAIAADQQLILAVNAAIEQIVVFAPVEHIKALAAKQLVKAVIARQAIVGIGAIHTFDREQAVTFGLTAGLKLGSEIERYCCGRCGIDGEIEAFAAIDIVGAAATFDRVRTSIGKIDVVGFTRGKIVTRCGAGDGAACHNNCLGQSP